jgi:hypothetical protein
MNKKAKIVDRDEYLNLAKNGVAKLFDWNDFEFAEGDNYDLNPETSYFVFNYDITETFVISESDMFEFVKINFVYNQDMKDELMIKKLIDLEIIQIID